MLTPQSLLPHCLGPLCGLRPSRHTTMEHTSRPSVFPLHAQPISSDQLLQPPSAPGSRQVTQDDLRVWTIRWCCLREHLDLLPLSKGCACWGSPSPTPWLSLFPEFLGSPDRSRSPSSLSPPCRAVCSFTSTHFSCLFKVGHGDHAGHGLCCSELWLSHLTRCLFR